MLRWKKAPRVELHSFDVSTLAARAGQSRFRRLRRSQAEQRALELLAKPIESRSLYAAHTRRYGRLEVVEVLVERARDLVAADPHAALEAGHAAVQAASNLKPPPGLELRRHDLWALACAWRANAARALGDLEKATRGMTLAWELRNRGSQDVLVEAWLQLLDGALARSRGEAQAALDLVQKAHKTLWKLGNDHTRWFSALVLAKTLEANGRIWDAMAAHNSVYKLSIAYGKRNPRFALLMAHVLFVYNTEVGNGVRARRMLEWIEPLYCLPENAQLELRARWAAGRMILREKKWARAAELLDGVRQGFAAQGDDFEAALAGLELCQAWSALGRTSEVRALAREMEDVFLSARVPAKAQEAFRLFVTSVETTRSVANLLDTLLARLEPVRRCPGRVARA